MHALLILLAALAAAPASQPSTQPSRGVIEATIRGTSQPLQVDLLLRDDSERWNEVGHQNLTPDTRRVRFDGLAAGVYQLLVRGSNATEQIGTKVNLGARDTRRTTITITPLQLTGRISLGGSDLTGGTLLLDHNELHWKGTITLGPDGTFRAPLWQRGTYKYSIHNPVLTTPHVDSIDITGASPAHLRIDVPGGRITGIVRDSKNGAPVANALVALQTNSGDVERHVRLTTGPEGRFNFTGMKFGRHTVRIVSARHLDPAPIVFELDATSKLRDLDIRLDPGRTIPIVVLDAANEPVANAVVFAVSDAKLRSRTMTAEDGRTTVSVPDGESATVFVVPASGAFGVQRIPREHDGKRLWVHLPRAASSLLIRARTTTGESMPPFSLLMRYDGALVPIEVAEELHSMQGLQLATGENSEALLRNIPSGSYEFWPYRTAEEAEAIVASGDAFAAPILVDVREGENKIAVKFSAK